ncbi:MULTISPECIES: succinate dehydrogenase cytochrome b subunit [Streptomyces]|uniref:Succinate dehydrogenase cytochrome b subunit n=2 Tax=Streptomyces rimosus subsp. rimosus TaxID=132474 RepID=L8EL79_STRR1|nr:MULTISPECIES: succinate dehydrogenase cytochrome b subunit [Streptomyces]KOG68513.1 succinate dehydrogenase [Kitasatospora aureofaciens]MYT46486.1 succinate dehydrogenase [Streptomyces sp. SID5471]KEF02186.1 succinate dehydrogenase [Streptomyces rimosus]KEF17529.1 succinate dehydrogenase [Streptomyces rimosus]KOT27040.1 succinate dehydrogenase [Streptomyces rimosus subsp. rimosus]
MALDTRTDRRPSFAGLLWHSTVGKKTAMAVSGVVMLLYLVAHMMGNLKIFFGPDELNGYGHWLRTVGEPFLHHEWFLWIARVVLLAAVLTHGVAAFQLSRRDIKARPSKYVHKKARTSYATRTMRWGGVILALFIVWHILDLTTLTVNPRAEAGHPYENLIASFDRWPVTTLYIVAMLALGLHIRHGFWSAAQTLGVGSAARDRVLKTVANLLALVLTAGFVAVPVAVVTGAVS